MSIGIIDVVEWQTTLDMRTGRRVEAEGPLVDLAGEILALHPPYPGDLDPKNLDWISGIARDLDEKYRPRFLMLTYGQLSFLSIYKNMPGDQRKEMIRRIIGDIHGLCETTGAVPFIVGTGGFVPAAGFVDLSRLDGLVLGGGMVGRYAGIYGPSAKDLACLRGNRFIKGVYSRREMIELFGGDEEFTRRLPDYLLVLKEGYIYKTVGSSSRPFFMQPAENESVPFSSPLGAVSSITGIRKLIEDALPAQKVVLAIIEGAGPEEFPEPYRLCDNSLGWYRYTPTCGQYLSMTTGRHLPYHTFIPGFKYYVEDDEGSAYPLSGLFTKNDLDTIGSSFAGRSAAVGTRSIMTHLASGADLTIECYSRGLYNYGTLAVINAPPLKG